MHSLEDIFYSTSWPLNYSSTLFDNLTYNGTNTTEGPSGGNQWHLPWWRQMIWTVLFAGMIVVATGGNLIVIWIVLAHKRMRTVTNYFLVNLSIADAMVSTLNVIFNYTYMLNSHWPFGNLYCKISQFIAVLTICASVFTLMAISIDRGSNPEGAKDQGDNNNHNNYGIAFANFSAQWPEPFRFMFIRKGGLVSGEEIDSERLHRPHNDEVYDLSEELSVDDHLKPGDSVIDLSESQSTTVSSISTTTGQSMMPLDLGEKRSHATVDKKFMATTERMDNMNGVTSKQFSDNIDGNILNATTEATGNHGETTELLPVTSLSINITQNREKEADLGIAITATDPGPGREENFVLDDDNVPPSATLPELNDEPESGTRKMNPNVQSTVEPIIDPISNTEPSAQSNSILSTDDISGHKEPIRNQNSKPHEAVRSDSKLSKQMFPKLGDTEIAQEKKLPEHNSSRDQYLEMNDGDAANDVSPNEKIKNEKSSFNSKEDSSDETNDNWLSVLRSIVPSQKERLDFNEQMLQSIQNTVSNSNVNQNVMNNPLNLPCSHPAPPASSNLYPPPYWLSSPISMPQLPSGVPIESDLSEEYSDFEIEPQSGYIDYTDIEKHNLHSPDQFVNPLAEWRVQPVEIQYSPIIQVGGEIVIQSQSQPKKHIRKCRKVLVKSKRMCKKEKPICHTPWSGCKPICRPGRLVCSEDPSQKLKFKLVCKEIWNPIAWPKIIYPAPSYHILDSEKESEQDQSVLESDECEHELPEVEILPTAESLEVVSQPFSEAKDTVPQDEEVSEQVFEEAIQKAISEAPEILAPEPIGDLESEILQKLRPVLGPPESAMKIVSPSNVVQSEKADDGIDELSVAHPEMPLKEIIEKEIEPHDGSKITNDSVNRNANHDVNTNVNFNQNINLNGNIAAQEPVFPDIQVPIISPVIKPLIHPESGKDNTNLNTNVNVNMNSNISHNHKAGTNHNKRLPIQPIVERESDKVTKTPQVEPTMPKFEHGAPLTSNLHIDNAKQNANINMNSNTNVNQNHNSNDKYEILSQPKMEIPEVKIIPQLQQPIGFQPTSKTTAEATVKNVQRNVDENLDDNVDKHIKEPDMPDVKVPEDAAVLDKKPIVFPDMVLPSVKQENQNGNVNANVNLNVNSNINKNGKPAISEVVADVPIKILEPIPAAEPPVEVSAPVYEVPSLPVSSASLNINANVNHNLNSNVNLNIINDTKRNVIQKPLTPPIHQPTPAPTLTLTESTPKLILIPEISDNTDKTMGANQNLNQILNSNINFNSNQNVNQKTTNQDTHLLPQIVPVVPEILPTPIAANIPGVFDSTDRKSNINHNVNRNVNINSNFNSAVNVPEVPIPSAPVMIPEIRPVAIQPEFTLPEVVPVAPVASEVSENRNANSNTNVNYNSNRNSDANHKIAAPSEQPVSPVIKPVESQPVAVAKHSETPRLAPVHTGVNQNLNTDTNVNENFNFNNNVNANHNVNLNAEEVPQVAKESAMAPTFTDPVVTQAPKLEVTGNKNVPAPDKSIISSSNENTELNHNQNINTNFNHNSNVNVNHNSNLSENNKIGNQRITLLPTGVPALVFDHEPILLPLQAKAPASPVATIVEPEILRSVKSNTNYNANVNVNHNSNSNVNFNRYNLSRSQEPILLPPLAPLPWIKNRGSQHQIIPNLGLNLVHDADVSFNENSNTNINQNVNLNHNRNHIVTREPSLFPETHEHLNKNDYPSILKPDVREIVTIAAPPPVLEERGKSIPKVTRDSQVNVNHNANVNMNYNSNYNNNANYNGKAVADENEKGKLPLIKSPQNVLAPVIVPQTTNRGTEPWNVQKNSNVNANYNSNINYNANVNANSNYNSNLGQSGLGILTPGTDNTQGNKPGIQNPIFNGNPAHSAPVIANSLIGPGLNPTQVGYNGQPNINTNANYNSNLNYNSNYNANYNHNGNYNVQATDAEKNPKKRGWYELWYNNGEDEDGWTEIWNNKQFQRFLEQQLKDMKQQEDIQAQAFAVAG